MENTKNNQWPISSQDKDKLINDLKETAKDLWIISYKLITPVINFIKNKYDDFTPERKQQLQNMATNLRNSTKNWIIAIKDFIVEFTRSFINEKKEQASNKINETKENIQEKTQDIKEQATEKYEDTKQKIIEKKDDILNN